MADEDEVVDEEPGVVQVDKADSEAALSPVEAEKSLAPPKYEVRPGLNDKFQSCNVKEIILTTMKEQLTGRDYNHDHAARWVKAISNAVRQRVQDLNMKRYKIIVQTTILEMKGAGFKSGQRCIWDPETDCYTNALYRTENIFCHTIVYGIYMY